VVAIPEMKIRLVTDDPSRIVAFSPATPAFPIRTLSLPVVLNPAS